MILINPTYEALRAYWVKPEELMQRGRVIHLGRNVLCVAEVEGLYVCVKQYGTPNRFKNLIYRYLRSPKGLRAWQNSLLLREAGIATPDPVAYIQKNDQWGIRESYYICLYQEGKTLYHWGNQGVEDIRKDLVNLAHFTARLHEAGLLMRDYTPGNILQTEDGFSLVDTNRMSQGAVSVQLGLRNMAGLWLQPEAAALLAREYASARHAAPEEAVARMRRYRRAFWKRFAQRHHLKGRIVHRDLDGSQYPYDLTKTI